MQSSKEFQIGVVGLGSFGNLLLEILPRIFPHASISGASHDQTEDMKRILRSDMVIPAVPIRAFEETIKTIIPSMKPDSLILDVCSVKEYPVAIMQAHVPPSIGIIASHPLFGRQSVDDTGGALKGLQIVFHNVSAPADRYEKVRHACVLAGLSVFEMSPSEHDRMVAYSQFPTHVLARLMHETKKEDPPVNTITGSAMLRIARSLSTDSTVLFEDMYRYNRFAKIVLAQMEGHFSDLVSQLHKTT